VFKNKMKQTADWMMMAETFIERTAYFQSIEHKQVHCEDENTTGKKKEMRMLPIASLFTSSRLQSSISI
jgi:hypothetical protein